MGVLPVVLVLALPAAAQESKPETVQPRPKSGGTQTTFVIRWVTDTDSDNSGEQFYVWGPRGTRCKGLVAYSPVGYTGGTQTVRVGPQARGEGERLFSVRPKEPGTEGPAKPLKRWCKGVYRGRVEFQNADGETEYTVVRFRFRVR